MLSRTAMLWRDNRLAARHFALSRSSRPLSASFKARNNLTLPGFRDKDMTPIINITRPLSLSFSSNHHQPQEQDTKSIDEKVEDLLASSREYLKTRDSTSDGTRQQLLSDWVGTITSWLFPHDTQSEGTVFHELLSEWGDMRQKGVSTKQLREAAETMDILCMLALNDVTNMASADISSLTNALESTLHAWGHLGNGKRAERLMNQFLRVQNEHPSLLKPSSSLYTGVLLAWSNDMKSVDSIQRSQHWLKQMQEDDQVEVTTSAWNNTLAAIANRGDADRAMKIFRNFPTRKNKYTFSIAMKAWSRSKSPKAKDEIQKLFRELKAEYIGQGRPKDLLPENSLYILVIGVSSGLEADDLLKELHESYEKTRDPELKPTVKTYAQVMQAWSKERNPSRVEQVLMEIQERSDGLRPNRTMYNIVVDTWAKLRTPEGIERAENILKHLEDNLQDIEGVDSYGYNSVMNAYSRSQGGAEKVAAMIDRLKQLASDHRNDDLMPTTVTYNIQMQAWIAERKHGYMDEVEALLERMEDDENNYPAPSLQSYSLVLDGWAKSGLAEATERAEDILRRMGERSIHPNSHCFSALINVYAESGDGKKAEAVLRLMESAVKAGNIAAHPNNVTYGACIKAWAKSDHLDDMWPRSSSLVDEMMRKFDEGDERCKPDDRVLTVVLMALARSSVGMKVQLAKEVINKFEAYGLELTAINRRVMLQVCLSVKGSREEKKEAFKLAVDTFKHLQRMGTSEVAPFVYNSMLRCIQYFVSDRREQSQLAEEVFRRCLDEGKASSRNTRVFRRIAPRSQLLKELDHGTRPSSKR